MRQRDEQQKRVNRGFTLAILVAVSDDGTWLPADRSPVLLLLDTAAAPHSPVSGHHKSSDEWQLSN